MTRNVAPLWLTELEDPAIRHLHDDATRAFNKYKHAEAAPKMKELMERVRVLSPDGDQLLGGAEPDRASPGVDRGDERAGGGVGAAVRTRGRARDGGARERRGTWGYLGGGLANSHNS